MITVTPFLWFDKEAEEAADFYLSIFPDAKKISEMRSNGVGPWPEGTIGVISIELMGQQMTFLNGGPHYKLNQAFSFFVACDTQEEIDRYWDALQQDGS